LNILSFNRHFYVVGLSALAVIIGSQLIFSWPPIILWVTISAFLYGLVMPLIVSAYVYDYSGYYTLDWLKKLAIYDAQVKTICNINAGFDETSFLLKDLYPAADIIVFDFYNAERHTEPAIIRARKVSITYPGTRQITTNAIPLNDKSTDLIFLLSAAHEIRSNEEKIQFLAECHRICKPGGRVIMVEHLRDFPNFLAFTVGFTHFFSRQVWKSAFTKAGFATCTETKFTPFMSIFNCTP
jgi:SAM-dependent methyltransferase